MPNLVSLVDYLVSLYRFKKKTHLLPSLQTYTLWESFHCDFWTSDTTLTNKDLRIGRPQLLCIGHRLSIEGSGLSIVSLDGKRRCGPRSRSLQGLSVMCTGSHFTLFCSLTVLSDVWTALTKFGFVLAVTRLVEDFQCRCWIFTSLAVQVSLGGLSNQRSQSHP